MSAVAFRPACDGEEAAGDSTPPFSPPLWVASAGADRCVRLWDARTRRCVRSASKLKAEPVALVWVGGSVCVLGCGDGTLLAWGSGGGGVGGVPAPLGAPPPGPPPPPKPGKPAPVPGWTPVRAGVTCLAAEPGPHPARLAVGCGDGSVWVVCLAGGGGEPPGGGGTAHPPPPPPPVRLWAHAASAPVQSLAWGGLGALASGGADGRVMVGWCVGRGAPLPATTTLTPAAAGAAAGAPDRRQWTAVAWVSVGMPAPTDLAAWWLLAGAGPGGEVVAWEAGSVVAAAAATTPSPPPPPPRPLALPPAHTRVVFALAPNASGSCLASAGMDRTVRLWRVGGGAAAVAGGAASTTAPSAPPPLLLRPGPALQGLGGFAYALAVRAGEFGSFPLPTVAVAAGDGTVRLWPVGESGGVPPPGTAAPLWRGLPPHATAAAWAPPGTSPTTLAVGGSDGSVGLLDPGAGACVRLGVGGGKGALVAPTPATPPPPVVALAWLPGAPSPASSPASAALPDLLSLHADGSVLRWGREGVAAVAAAAAGAKGSGRRAGGGAPPPPPPPATAARPTDFLAELAGDAASPTPWSTASGDTPACLAVCAWRGGAAVALGGAAGGLHTSTAAAAASSPSLSWSRPASARPHEAAVTQVAWRVVSEGGEEESGALLPWLASVGEDGVVAAHPPPAPPSPSPRPPAALLPGDGRPLTALAWASAGLILAVGRGDGSLLVVSVGGGGGSPTAPRTFSLTPVRELSRHGARVRGLAWLPHHDASAARPPHLLLSCADDQSVRLWEVAGGEEGEGGEKGVVAAAPPPPPPPPRRPAGPAAAAAATFSLGPTPLARALEGGAVPAPAHTATAGAAAAALAAAAEGEDDAAASTAEADPATSALHTRRAAALRLWAGDAQGAVRTLLLPASSSSRGGGGGAPPTPHHRHPPPAPSLDAHAVALAASAGRGAWVAAARAYAAALAATGEAAAAATYLVAAGDAPAAVRVLARGGRRGDAVALAAARLPVGHPARAAVEAREADQAAEGLDWGTQGFYEVHREQRGG